MASKDELKRRIRLALTQPSQLEQQACSECPLKALCTLRPLCTLRNPVKTVVEARS